MRRLQRFGVTPGELERYKMALLRDSGQAAEQVRAEAVHGRNEGKFRYEQQPLHWLSAGRTHPKQALPNQSVARPPCAWDSVARSTVSCRLHTNLG